LRVILCEPGRMDMSSDRVGVTSGFLPGREDISGVLENGGWRSVYCQNSGFGSLAIRSSMASRGDFESKRTW
jgi:hypothetical protein